MGWRSGDANWLWKVDVFSSLDGKEYAPVPALQGVNMHQKWGDQFFPAFKPFGPSTSSFITTKMVPR